MVGKLLLYEHSRSFAQKFCKSVFGNFLRFYCVWIENHDCLLAQVALLLHG